MRNSILGLFIGFGIIITPASMAQYVPETIQQKIDNGRKAMIAGNYLQAIAEWEAAQANLISRRNTETIDLETEILIHNYLSLGYQEIGDFKKAETAIITATKLLENESLNTNLIAKVFNTQANLNLKQDDPQTAALNFREAKQIYQKNNDLEGAIGATINEAIALQKLGQYHNAQKNLEKIELQLEEIPETLQASLYKALGTTYATIGNFPAAQEKLEASIALTQDIDIETTAKTKIDLATVIQYSQPQTASKLLQEVVSVSQNSETQAIALLNLIHLEMEAQNWDKAIAIADQSQDLIFNLPHNDFAKINLIKKMAQLDAAAQTSQLIPISKILTTNKSPSLPVSPSPHQSYVATIEEISIKKLTSLKSLVNKSSSNLIKHKQLLEQIAQSARSRGAKRTESYATGTLAYLEEAEGNLEQAIALNRSALTVANAIAAEDIADQWQWQLGRILKSQGDLEGAIISYQEAVANLDAIRDNLVSFNPESQYSFRESIEPVYRQLVGLLITNPTQDNLIQARNTIESLQIAEMENYFRQACLEAKPEQIDQIDPQAATIYPILTGENLAVLTSIPGQPIKLFVQPITPDQIEAKVRELLGHFNISGSNKRRKALSQEFYSWLVKPTLNDLKTAQIETLVFVLDGSMRNLPIAALYDGEKYLVEDYAISLTPGLQLLPSKTLATNKMKVVLGGVSESNQGFSALPGVEKIVD